MKPYLRYTLLRFLILFALIFGLYAIGMRGIPLILTAAFVAAGVSYFGLRNMRDQVTSDMAEWVVARRERKAQATPDEVHEDAANAIASGTANDTKDPGTAGK